MQILKIILIVALTGIFTINAQSQDFIGTWQASYDGMFPLLSKKDQRDIRKESRSNRSLYKSIINGTKYTFGEDGTLTMEFTAMGTTRTNTGTWSLSEDQKTLTLVTIYDDGDTHTDIFDIEEATKEKLILYNQDPEATDIIWYFLPAE